MIDLQHYIAQFIAHPGSNDAIIYGVRIQTMPGAQWRCIGVHLLTGPENGGQHNVFIEPLDATGKRVAECVAAWQWEGQHQGEMAPDTPLDKPPGEVAGNIPLGPGQIATVWLTQQHKVISDKVSGLTTAPNIPDVPGATRFHQSYLVVFQRGGNTSPPPPPDETAEIERLKAICQDARAKAEAARIALSAAIDILKAV